MSKIISLFSFPSILVFIAVVDDLRLLLLVDALSLSLLLLLDGLSVLLEVDLVLVKGVCQGVFCSVRLCSDRF